MVTGEPAYSAASSAAPGASFTAATLPRAVAVAVAPDASVTV